MLYMHGISASNNAVENRLERETYVTIRSIPSVTLTSVCSVRIVSPATLTISAIRIVHATASPGASVSTILIVAWLAASAVSVPRELRAGKVRGSAARQQGQITILQCYQLFVLSAIDHRLQKILEFQLIIFLNLLLRFCFASRGPGLSLMCLMTSRH